MRCGGGPGRLWWWGVWRWQLSLTNLDSWETAFDFEWGDSEFNLDCYDFFEMFDDDSCSGTAQRSLDVGNYRLDAEVSAGLYGRDLGATFEMSIVPEPHSATLFGIGSLIVGAATRRKLSRPRG